MTSRKTYLSDQNLSGSPDASGDQLDGNIASFLSCDEALFLDLRHLCWRRLGLIMRTAY